MLITLPSYLAYNFQLGDDEIGQLKAIILIPWSFKLLWAPLMDTFTIRSMGRRRPWIIGSELLMALSLLGFIGLSNPSEQLRFILYLYFLHNCFASLQDVCTDALAVDVLPASEHGQTNGLMWGSKLVGKGIGAWGLSLVLNWGGLSACVVVQVALLLAIMMLPLLILERKGEKRFPWSAGAASSEVTDSVRNPREVLDSFKRAFSLLTTVMFFVFAVVQGVGNGVASVVTNTLYTQWVNPRWTDTDFSTVSGLYSTPLIIVGAVLGGFLADRYGGRVILCVGSGGYGLVTLLFAACPWLWDQFWFTSSYLLASETLNALSSVGYLAVAMRISWTRSAAIVFTTYMTLGNVTHVFGNWLAGRVREFCMFGLELPVALQEASAEVVAANLTSYGYTFGFAGVITLLPLLLLFFVRPQQIDNARQQDEPD
jgi:PAT family beta-lactamase induction signal transducer AmpG